jgi:membrane-bound metal-dependent hydrolase YbcI (DUF457 family)
MDALTHTVVALAIGLAVYPRRAPGRARRAGLLWLVAAANTPEIERAAGLYSPAAMVKVIYGAGHSLLTVPALALLLAAVVAHRLHNWRTAAGIAGLGLGSHLILDFLSGPGLRLFWPLRSAFYGLRLIASYDLWILLVLAVALIGPMLLNLVNQDIGAVPYSPQKAARVGLVMVLVLLFARGATKFVLEGRAAEPSAGFALEPSPLNPLTWYAVSDDGNAYQVDELTPWGYGPTLRFRKAEPNRAFETAADTALGQAFLEMAKFPQYSLEHGEKGMLVRIRDLRFYTPAGEGKEYSVEIEVTPQLEVVRERARM